MNRSLGDSYSPKDLVLSTLVVQLSETFVANHRLRTLWGSWGQWYLCLIRLGTTKPAQLCETSLASFFFPTVFHHYFSSAGFTRPGETERMGLKVRYQIAMGHWVQTGMCYNLGPFEGSGCSPVL